MLTTVVENNDMERTCLVRWTDRVAQVVECLPSKCEGRPQYHQKKNK
jgi:hypothetical protein